MGPQTESMGVKKNAGLSRLMRAQSREAAAGGGKPNFCPFGCPGERLDENGYCHHLVGFTNDLKMRADGRYLERQDESGFTLAVPKDGAKYEPMVRAPRGRKVVRCKMRCVEEADPETGAEAIMAPVLEPVMPGDKLVRISVSARVYRENPKVEVQSKKPA